MIFIFYILYFRKIILISSYQIMQNNNSSNKFYSPKLTTSFLVVLILLCTALIISTNYLFSTKTIKDIEKLMKENEYSKVWWEENYKLLLEIEKEEKQKYIDELNKTNPEYIKEIKTKIQNEEKNTKILSWEEINILKSNTALSWSTGSTFSLIEFSDYECEYCKKYHSEKTISKTLESYSWSINYIFKNMPTKDHNTAFELSKYARCFYKEAWDEIYFDFINNAFSSWALENISAFWEENNINEENIKNCISSYETSIELKNEIWQWIYLWIKSIPSVIILNNETWEYKLIEWKKTQENLKLEIDNFIK